MKLFRNWVKKKKKWKKKIGYRNCKKEKKPPNEERKKDLRAQHQRKAELQKGRTEGNRTLSVQNNRDNGDKKRGFPKEGREILKGCYRKRKLRKNILVKHSIQKGKNREEVTGKTKKLQCGIGQGGGGDQAKEIVDKRNGDSLRQPSLGEKNKAQSGIGRSRTVGDMEIRGGSPSVNLKKPGTGKTEGTGITSRQNKKDLLHDRCED